MRESRDGHRATECEKDDIKAGNISRLNSFLIPAFSPSQVNLLFSHAFMNAPHADNDASSHSIFSFYSTKREL
jgi:hypothetical protein